MAAITANFPHNHRGRISGYGERITSSKTIGGCKTMIVHLVPGIGQDDSRVNAIVTKARQYELLPEVHQEQGAHHAVVIVHLKDGKQRARAVPDHVFATMEGVKEVIRVSPAQISLAMNGGNEPHHVQIGNSLIGKGLPCLPVIGSCTIDSLTPELIRLLANLGVRHIRGGWRKPRSSAQSYRGPGQEGLFRLLIAAAENKIESVWTEVVESGDIDIVRRIKNQVGYFGDIVLWVGARNIGNYLLLQALGQQDEFKVMLKNGIHMQTVDELFTAAEFVLAGPMYWDSETGILDERRSRAPGNQELILCVRGLHNRDAHSRLRFYPNYDWITACH